MERILIDNEKIRRAEEIYLRRNNKGIQIPKEKDVKVKTYIGSKVLLQFVVLLNIAIIVFAFQNKEYIFKEEFLRSFEKYNIDINSKINSILNFINLEEIKQNLIVNEENVINNEKQEVEESKEDIVIDGEVIGEEVSQEEQIVTEGTGGAIVENNMETSSLSQMDIDIENINKSYNFTKPVEGTVSSLFGARESAYQKVSGYHTGIDVAAPKGTKIKAAFTGMVTLVSSEGDYRKTFKNYM